jgi:hypothetical protein
MSKKFDFPRGDEMTPSKRLARIAGVLYLGVAVFSFFAFFYVKSRLYVPGDAVATTANVVSNAELFRLGFLADLMQATLFLFVGLTLYTLLQHVSKSAARAMVACVAVSVAIMCANALYQFAALKVATDRTGSDALVQLLMDLNHYGFLIAQIFFGLWLVPLGYLAYRSGMFPRPLGVILIVGGCAYLVDFLMRFLVPSLGDTVGSIVTAPSAIAELWMVGYLLVKGIR